MQIKKKGQEGFTLIELLVVVVIIGILSSVAVPNFMGAQDKAKNSGVQSNVHIVQMALEQWAVDNSGTYPTNIPAIITAGGYMQGDAYPKTPWNTQQAPTQAIAAATGSINASLGAGTSAAPTTNSHFGAIGYTRSANAGINDRYDLSGIGKRGSNAILSQFIKNY